MKIVVAGQIIDTDNIYSISDEIDYNYLDRRYYFTIISFNDHNIEVGISELAKNKVSEEWDKLRENNSSGRQVEADYLDKIKELRNQVPIENKKRLEKMRQDIVKLWSENQSTIPNFKVENY